MSPQQPDLSSLSPHFFSHTMTLFARQFSSSAAVAAKRLPSFAGIPSVDMKKYTKDIGEYADGKRGGRGQAGGKIWTIRSFFGGHKAHYTDGMR